jgi:hypothetical protein
MHARQKPQLVLNFAKERRQLLLLVVGNLRIDRNQIPSARLLHKGAMALKV